MMILALLTLLLITNGSAEGKMANVTGDVGQNVVLPCGCSNESDLVWQRSKRVVNAYPQDETISIDQDYMNRTELFLKKEKTNCSLVIHNISLADAGVYTCHYLVKVNVIDKVWLRKSSEVNLTVTENLEASVDRFDDKPNPVSISVPILVILILAVAVLLTLLIKRRHRTNTETDLQAQQPMIENV